MLACCYPVTPWTLRCILLEFLWVVGSERCIFFFYSLYVVQECTDHHKRPYHRESTWSRPISEVKHGRARLVRWWETTLEVRVSLLPFAPFHHSSLPASSECHNTTYVRACASYRLHHSPLLPVVFVFHLTSNITNKTACTYTYNACIYNIYLLLLF